MRRRVIQDDGTNVSLLPFLAVLICTMGALIILLVVVVQQARVSAQMASLSADATPQGSDRPGAAVTTGAETELPARSDQPHVAMEVVEHAPQPLGEAPLVDAKTIEQRQETRDKLLWEIKIMQESRKKTGARVEERRLELSQVESHARTLEAQLERLQDDAARVEQAATSQADIGAAKAERLSELRKELAMVKLELDQSKLHKQQQSRSFAVVPYRGPHGTVRQPFYIECLGDGVLLQPEGIRLNLSDLTPPLGPANPLAAALRQKREWLATQRGGQLGSEPYPLLIVRPDGSSTYQRARVALQSWGTEFGYELIEADRPLVYPPVAPGVIPGMQQAIAQARQRQALERRVAKSVERQRSKRNVLRASPRGGFVHYDGRPITAQDFADGAAAAAESSPGSSELAGTPESTDQVRPSTMSPPVVMKNLPLRELQDPQDLPAERNPLALRGSQLEGGAWSPTRDHRSMAVDDETAVRRDAAFELIPRQAGGDASATLATPPPALQSDWTNVQRAVTSSREHPSAVAGRSTLDSAASAGAGSPTENSSSGDSSVNGHGSPNGGPAAGDGGLDWAVPQATADAIAITRPIDGHCELQRIVLMPEAGSRARPIEIRFEGATANALRPFAGAIRQQIDSWGIAGSGVYWKPVLRLSVAPNAGPRFIELQSQLRDSGIEILRR